jgi:hypothetical protein
MGEVENKVNLTITIGDNTSVTGTSQNFASKSDKIDEKDLALLLKRAEDEGWSKQGVEISPSGNISIKTDEGLAFLQGKLIEENFSFLTETVLDEWLAGISGIPDREYMLDTSGALASLNALAKGEMSSKTLSMSDIFTMLALILCATESEIRQTLAEIKNLQVAISMKMVVNQADLRKLSIEKDYASQLWQAWGQVASGITGIVSSCIQFGVSMKMSGLYDKQHRLENDIRKYDLENAKKDLASAKSESEVQTKNLSKANAKVDSAQNRVNEAQNKLNDANSKLDQVNSKIDAALAKGDSANTNPSNQQAGNGMGRAVVGNTEADSQMEGTQPQNQEQNVPSQSDGEAAAEQAANDRAEAEKGVEDAKNEVKAAKRELADAKNSQEAAKEDLDCTNKDVKEKQKAFDELGGQEELTRLEDFFKKDPDNPSTVNNGPTRQLASNEVTKLQTQIQHGTMINNLIGGMLKGVSDIVQGIFNLPAAELKRDSELLKLDADMTMAYRDFLSKFSDGVDSSLATALQNMGKYIALIENVLRMCYDVRTQIARNI